MTKAQGNHRAERRYYAAWRSRARAIRREARALKDFIRRAQAILARNVINKETTMMFSKFLRILPLLLLGLCPALAQALSIDLAWDYPATPPVLFTEFRMYRSNSPDLASFPVTPLLTGIPPTARAVSDSTVTYQTQYCYYATAYRVIDASTTAESLPSNVVCKTMPAQPPEAVTNLRSTIRP